MKGKKRVRDRKRNLKGGKGEIEGKQDGMLVPQATAGIGNDD